jgi:hypothetical protein
VIMLQTADATSHYREILELTGAVNRTYCQRWGIRYQSLLGVRCGAAPWMATYNRIFLLDDLIRVGYQGWVVYLDADAFVVDMGFDLPDYLKRNEQYCFIGTEGGEEPWKINAGICFLNLGDSYGRSIAHRWKMLFNARLPSDYLADPDAKWHVHPSDQALLHLVLQQDGRLLERCKKVPRGFFDYHDGRYIVQHSHWKGEQQKRLDWIRGETTYILKMIEDGVEWLQAA